MKHPDIHYRKQLQSYLDGTLAPDEIDGLLHYLATEEGEELAESLSNDQWERIKELPLSISPTISRQMKQRLMAAVAPAPRIRRVHFLRTAFFRYAALVIMLVTAAYFWIQPGKKTEQQLSGNGELKKNIQPGSTGGLLMLADGNTLVLDSLEDGLVAVQNGSNVVLTDGRLAYTKTTEADPGASFNTLVTPKGRQFQLLLPDGSRVWLNAASSLRYPTAFNGKERKVEITGEAYFEIRTNADMPFTVNAGKTEVRVLGTSFNINAYEDEPVINTTLLEGRVQVKTYNRSQLLRPGQQALVAEQGKTIQLVKDADIESVIAWKNGLFSFRDARIEQVMRQLARWYNVEVRYEGPVPEHSFVGKISKSYDLSEALEVLKASDVNFRIENDTIVIKK